jgi:glycine/D-amino acid oxidase-like deaminating enzyme
MDAAEASARRALADADPRIFWLDRDDAPAPVAALTERVEADLCIVGGGFTGLWAALQAKRERPERDVVLLEAETVAFGASGRNGGFMDSSLTHGLANGIAHFPDEIETLVRLGRENYAAIKQTLADEAIDADWTESGMLAVATEPHQVQELREYRDESVRFGGDAVFLDRDAMSAELDSPTYLAGTWLKGTKAIVDPAQLAWGLRRAALAHGVRLHERTPVTRLSDDGSAVQVETELGAVRAARVVVGTSAYPSPLKRIQHWVAPVYDYVLMTEPLSAEQLASIGWRNRQGTGDSGNQFHYYRLTADDRILWGGYDAIYHYGNDVGPQRDQRMATFRKLAAHFFETFPQLEGLRFTHRWGGAIDTCSRFCVMFGTAHRGKTAYAVGYTGLGVGATRFGARVALDLVDGADNERTRLQLVRSKPLPFPPEPLRWPAIEVTRRSLNRADERGGRRNAWLRLLDRIGAGFDS